jgi:hypothetical protein
VWVQNVRKECRLKVSENSVLRGGFEPRRHIAKGCVRKLHSSSNLMKKDEIGEEKNCTKF